MSYPLSTLRSKVRRRSDRENDPHLSDNKVDDFIEYAINDLYGLIISIDPGYFKQTFATFNTTANTTDYSLPTDFYKLTSVNAKFGNDYRNVDRYSHSERNNSSLVINEFKYDLFGSKIRFIPVPEVGTTIKLEYIATPSLSLWSVDIVIEYLITVAAIMSLEDEDSDTSNLERRLVKLEERVLRCIKRDDAEPPCVSDVYNNSYEVE